MKFKVGLIFFVVVIVLVAFFVFQNSGDVQLNLYPGESIHLPVSIVILGSIILGVFIMFLISLAIEFKLRMKSRKVEKTLNKKVNSLKEFKKGLIELLSGRIKNAKKELSLSLKQDPDNFVPLLYLKDIEEGKNVENTINQLPVELRKFYLIEHFFAKENFENVIELAEEFINDKNFKNVEILTKIRDSYVKLKDFDKALEVQNKIGKEDEKFEELLYLKAKNSKDLNDVNNFIKKFPKSVSGYMLKFEINKDIDALKEGFKKTEDPIFLYKLFELWKDENNEKAEKILMKINSIPVAKFFKALILYKKGETSKAKDLVTPLLQNDDLKLISSLLLAEITYRQEGELKESFEYMRKILNIDEFRLFDFICENCKSITLQWFDFCVSCKCYNSCKLKWLK